MFCFQNEVLKITFFLIIKVIQTFPFLGQDGVVAFLPIPSAKDSSDDIIKQIQDDSKRWREGRLVTLKDMAVSSLGLLLASYFFNWTLEM